jgi:hypothetical protein
MIRFYANDKAPAGVNCLFSGDYRAFQGAKINTIGL